MVPVSMRPGVSIRQDLRPGRVDSDVDRLSELKAILRTGYRMGHGVGRWLFSIGFAGWGKRSNEVVLSSPTRGYDHGSYSRISLHPLCRVSVSELPTLLRGAQARPLQQPHLASPACGKVRRCTVPAYGNR